MSKPISGHPVPPGEYADAPKIQSDAPGGAPLEALGVTTAPPPAPRELPAKPAPPKKKKGGKKPAKKAPAKKKGAKPAKKSAKKAAPKKAKGAKKKKASKKR
jgi:hypothetical protein